MKYFLNRYQQNIENVCQAGPDTGIGNQGGYIRFDEDMDIMRLRRATWLVTNSPAIMGMCPGDDGSFEIREEPVYREEQVDIIDTQSEEEMLAYVQQQMTSCHIKPGNPLFRAWIMRCMEGGKEKLWLCGVFHHLIVDGFSIVHILRQITEIYDELAENDGMAYLQKKEASYRHYIDIGQISCDGIEKTRWYMDMAHLTDYSWKIKNQGVHMRAREEVFEPDKSLLVKLRKFAKEQHQSLEVIIMAALNAYVALRSGSRQVVISRTFLNRTKENLNDIGMYANALPIPVKIEENCNFLDLCNLIEASFSELTPYSGYSYYELQESLDSQELPYDLAVCYNNERFFKKMRHGERCDVFCGFCEIPMRIQIYEKKEALSIRMQYQTQCYTPVEIKSIFKSLEYLLEQALSNPDIMDMQLVKEEAAWLCPDENINIPEQTISGKFYDCVKERPKEKAIVYYSEENCHKNVYKEGSLKKSRELTYKKNSLKKSRELTYEQCGLIVEKLAEKLQENGVKPGDVVGIHVSRSEPVSLAIMAILSVGAAFFMISTKEEEALVKKLYAQCEFVIEGICWEKIFEEDNYLNINIIKVDKIQNSIDKSADLNVSQILENNSDKITADISDKDKMVYIMRTSGTTGTPKYAMISEKSLYLRLLWHEAMFGKNPVVLQKTGVTFDVSVWELLYPLLSGGTQVILPQGQELNLAKVVNLIETEHITHIHFVPTVLKLFCDQPGKNMCASLKYIIASGEALSVQLVRQVKSRFPHVELYNLYGPAECTIDVSYYKCIGTEEKVPIGKPLWNTQFAIVTEEGRLLPECMEGEIIIAGDLVGAGYCGEEKEAFFAWNEIRCYKTGDRGYIGEDGLLYFCGRSDRQYKLHGMRIDLNGIEEAAAGCPRVTGAVAEIVNDKLVLNYTGDITQAEVLKYMKNHVPYYYMPAYVQKIENTPVTVNGKLDRKSILAASQQKRQENRFAEEKTSLTNGENISLVAGIQQLKALTEEILQISVEIDDNLLEYGMDSLNMMELLTKFSKKGQSLELTEFYPNPTIRHMAELLEEKQHPQKAEEKNSGKNNCRQNGRDDGKTVRELYICVPYAAGGAESFQNLIKNMPEADFEVVTLKQWHDNYDISNENYEEIVHHILKSKSVSGVYKVIHVIGCCVGSSLAIMIYRTLQQQEYPVGNLILCGALPYDGIRVDGSIKSVWDFVPDFAVNRVLNPVLNGKEELQKQVLSQFRMDVKTSCSLLSMLKSPVKIQPGFKLKLIFGSRDKFTLGYRKRYRSWKSYLKGHVSICTISGAGHYFLSTDTKEAVKCIHT